ncbi:MAG TPA: hypothetical protein PK393_02290 [Synergistaceae bacterium]|nr:hypothetical protein [Synergistaceae bacterium]
MYWKKNAAERGFGLSAMRVWQKILDRRRRFALHVSFRGKKSSGVTHHGREEQSSRLLPKGRIFGKRGSRRVFPGTKGLGGGKRIEKIRRG